MNLFSTPRLPSGTVILEFDNSYSWMTSKSILYDVEVMCGNMHMPALGGEEDAGEEARVGRVECGGGGVQSSLTFCPTTNWIVFHDWRCGARIVGLKHPGGIRVSPFSRDQNLMFRHDWSQYVCKFLIDLV